MGILKSSFLYVTFIFLFMFMTSNCVLSEKTYFRYEYIFLNLTIILPYLLGFLFIQEIKKIKFFLWSFILSMIFYFLIYLFNLSCIYHDFNFNLLSWMTHALYSSIFYICLLGLSVLSVMIFNKIRNT